MRIWKAIEEIKTRLHRLEHANAAGDLAEKASMIRGYQIREGVKDKEIANLKARLDDAMKGPPMTATEILYGRAGFLVHGNPVVDSIKVFEEMGRLKKENEKLRLQATDERAEVERWKRKHEFLTEMNDKNCEAALRFFNKVEKVKEKAVEDSYPTVKHLRTTILAILNEP